MCARFETDKSLFQKALAVFDLELTKENWKSRIYPHYLSPVVKFEDNKFKLKMYYFALNPFKNNEIWPKFPTHNARIEGILTKRTWKNIFPANHCLVPMTSFLESVKEGKYAGNMVKFEFSKCIFVPAIFNFWEDIKTKNKEGSFSILTCEAGKFVEKTGHERSPIFIKQNITTFKNWFNVEKNNSKEFIKLLSERYEPKMKVIIDRPLKAGWEKRD